MREMFELENGEGYRRELEERLALAGCSRHETKGRIRETLGQLLDPDDEDLDEDELEDEELVHQALDFIEERGVLKELELESAGDVRRRRE